MEELLTFQRFNDLALATEFAERLRQLGIYCRIDNQSAPFDVTFANNVLEDDVRIKLLPGDFDKANEALDEYYKSLLGNVEPDYYLFQFTDAELMEIIAKPDEWNRFDFQLAQKLLQERGEGVTKAQIDALHEQRIADLSKKENIPWLWVYIGYVAAILGGFFGVIIALLLIKAKKTLPDGQRVYIYKENQRRHGRIILNISIITIPIWYILVMIGGFR